MELHLYLVDDVPVVAESYKVAIKMLYDFDEWEANAMVLQIEDEDEAGFCFTDHYDIPIDLVDHCYEDGDVSYSTSMSAKEFCRLHGPGVVYGELA